MFFKENMTAKEIEILANMLTGRLRNAVLEDIHAERSKLSWSGEYIPQEVMGPLQDAIRNSLYEMIFVLSQHPGTEWKGIDAMNNYIEDCGGFFYPITVNETDMELLRLTLSGGDVWGFISSLNEEE